MNESILQRLRPITAEEQAILQGGALDRDLYMQDSENRINAKKLLSAGKWITLRTHTRFLDFPEHTHDYIEVVYMCAGETTHFVNGQRIILRQGELLFLNQQARHAVSRAEKDDIAVNFIVLPDFFTTILPALGEEETPLRRFLVDCLCGETKGTAYLHFHVSDLPAVQNLVENLLFALLENTPNRRKISQMTMTLLFLLLCGHTETMTAEQPEQVFLVQVLSYVEGNYANGSLTELAENLHYDLYWLSREIRRKTGKTYTQLVQEKRLAQAAFLLRNTDRNVDDIANAVGYENLGYFHRIFREGYGCSPREYRLQIR